MKASTLIPTLSVALMRTISLAVLPLGALILVTAAAPAATADPVCVPGFTTIVHTSGFLRCRKTVKVGMLKGSIGQAKNANCNTDAYWNFGPKVSVKQTGFNVSVTYDCGHVEG